MENNQTSPCCDKHRSLFKDFVGDLKCKYVTAIDKETREEYSIYILNLLITFNVQCNGKTFTSAHKNFVESDAFEVRPGYYCIEV